MNIRSKAARTTPPPGGCTKRTILIVIIVLAAIVLGIRSCVKRRRARQKNTPVYVAEKGPLTISITESGSIENKEKVVVRSEVEGRTTIIWLVDEGKSIKKGDLLVELDSSTFEDQKLEQEIRLQNAEANLIRATENHAVVTNQALADIEQAELDAKFSKLNMEKYVEGEYPQELQTAEAEITIAQEELKKAQDNEAWSRQLAEKGYITRNELLADELAVKRATINLQLSQSKLELLKKYTHGQEVEKLASDAKQAEMALDRIKRKSKASIVQAEADLLARKAEHARQKTKLDKILQQIVNCRITAPSDGMVVYATTSRHRWHRGEPLDVGQEVQERQELIHLPTTSAMMAKISIQEASLTKVKVGMPVRIKIDALPSKTFNGSLAKISVMPDTSMAWLNPDLKVYKCEVYVDDEPRDAKMRPGMSCSCEIIIREYDNVLYIPIQSVLRVEGKPTAYVMGRWGSKPRDIQTGMDNNRMIHVISGLEPGEKVLLAPPLPPSAVKATKRPGKRHKRRQE